MITNKVVLATQNLKTFNAMNHNKREYASNPSKLMKMSMQARIRRSHDNLFNFINDIIQ